VSDCDGPFPMRQLILVGFLQAQNCTNLASSWRHPQSRTDSCSPDFYSHIGRVLEEGKFHLGFFDDRLSMPDMYGRNHAHTVEHGIRCVKLDAVTVLTVLGMATERLGLGATYSTSYYEPFHVARVFATLDLMTGGRAAWNVVTSLNDGEAQNMGRDGGNRPRPALRPPRRIHGNRARALGTHGKTMPSFKTKRRACSPSRTRFIASIIKAAISVRADRSPCHARREATQ